MQSKSTRFQMRCDQGWLQDLDQLRKAFGVRTRPEVLRILVKRTVDKLQTRGKDKR
jgi:hypothetical protein